MRRGQIRLKKSNRIQYNSDFRDYATNCECNKIIIEGIFPALNQWRTLLEEGALKNFHRNVLILFDKFDFHQFERDSPSSCREFAFKYT